MTSGRSKLDLDDAGRCVTLYSGSEKNPAFKTLVTMTVPGYSGNVFDSDDHSRKANRERALPKAAVSWSQKRERAYTQETKPSVHGKKQIGFTADMQPGPGPVPRALKNNAEIKILTDGNIAAHRSVHSPGKSIGRPLQNISEEKLSEKEAVFMRTGFSYEKKSMGADSKIEITYDELDNKLLQKLNPKLNQETYTLKYKLAPNHQFQILPASSPDSPALINPRHPRSLRPNRHKNIPKSLSLPTKKNLHNNSKTIAINNCHNIESNFSTENMILASKENSTRVSNIDLDECNSPKKKKLAMTHALDHVTPLSEADLGIFRLNKVANLEFAMDRLLRRHRGKANMKA